VKLLIRLNVVFVIAFVVVGWLAYAACAALQQADARREVQTRVNRILWAIAAILVDRAAAVAGDVAELERRLAAEIDSPEDQRHFVQIRS
jgi:hypothetical protein